VRLTASAIHFDNNQIVFLILYAQQGSHVLILFSRPDLQMGYGRSVPIVKGESEADPATECRAGARMAVQGE
jgi:hypothetical protein